MNEEGLPGDRVRRQWIALLKLCNPGKNEPAHQHSNIYGRLRTSDRTIPSVAQTIFIRRQFSFNGQVLYAQSMFMSLTACAEEFSMWHAYSSLLRLFQNVLENSYKLIYGRD